MKSYIHLVEDLELSLLTYEISEEFVEEGYGDRIKYGVGGFGSMFTQREKEGYIGHDEDDDRHDYVPKWKSKGKSTYARSTSTAEPHAVHINGKKWKTFDSLSHATNVMNSMLRKDPSKKISVVKEDLDEARCGNEGIYHDTYSAALQHAYATADKKGYQIDDEDYHKSTAHVDPKPHSGETKILSFPLTKNGKTSKQQLHVQVYNRGNDVPTKYELNHYIA